jgi:hypothetical protein
VDSPDTGAKWFWPTVVVGSILGWTVEWLLSRSDAAPLMRVLVVPLILGLSALAGGLLMREGHRPAAAFSVVLPIAIALVATWLFAHGGITWLVVYAIAVGFFLWFSSSDRLVHWWYRVVLRSRLQPPEVK